ncbi:MAG: ABC transporter permease subunit [Streptomycetaceae bacterium]|nr:MAG: ABC transporter permease subunit [Streptomycetaceae bacterium]
MKQRLNFSNYIVLLAASAFFIFPMVAAFEFSLRINEGKSYGFANYRWVFAEDGFATNLGVSFRLALLTAICVLVLMVPTIVYLHLGGARWKRLVEFVCLVPLVVPVISFALGVGTAFPTFLQSTVYELSFLYVIVSLPYTYRALDVGLSSIPLLTLVEASRASGASMRQTLMYVIIPTIRTAVNGAIFLAVALSLGEFTLAVLLHWDTFPTWIANVSQGHILNAIALSVLSLFGAWIVVMIFALAPKSLRSNKIQEATK